MIFEVIKWQEPGQQLNGHQSRNTRVTRKKEHHTYRLICDLRLWLQVGEYPKVVISILKIAPIVQTAAKAKGYRILRSPKSK